MKRFAIFALFLVPCLTFAQSNYHKGSVIIANGSTLTGYINTREWEENPKVIAFKAALEDKPQSFYPKQILSFTVDEFDKYFSYAVNISLSTTRFTELKTGRDTSNINDQVFLKLLTTGDKLSLYSYTDSIKTRFYIQDKQDQPEELSFQEYYIGSGTRIDKRYIGQLTILANKYGLLSQLQNTIDKTLYNNLELTAVVRAINGNKKTDKKSSTPRARFYAGAALNISQSGFTGNDLLGAEGITTTPKFDFGIDILPNPNVQKVFFRFQVSFSYINPVINKNTADISNYASQSYQYNQYNIAFSPQIVWNLYNKDAFKFYLNGGLAINLSSYSGNKYTVVQNTGSTSSPVYTSSQIEPYKLNGGPSMNFPIQTGFVFNKRLELFFTYTTEYFYANYLNISLSTSGYSAGVHYLFDRTSKK